MAYHMSQFNKVSTIGARNASDLMLSCGNLDS